MFLQPGQKATVPRSFGIVFRVTCSPTIVMAYDRWLRLDIWVWCRWNPQILRLPPQHIYRSSCASGVGWWWTPDGGGKNLHQWGYQPVSTHRVINKPLSPIPFDRFYSSNPRRITTQSYNVGTTWNATSSPHPAISSFQRIGDRNGTAQLLSAW